MNKRGYYLFPEFIEPELVSRMIEDSGIILRSLSKNTGG